MRVLLISQYFFPEVTAAVNRLVPFARGLSERGHEVEVVAQVPSHPQGIVHPGYGHRFVQREVVEGADVSYVWSYASPRRTAVRRLGSYASYALNATFVGARGGRPDVVFASSPPLSVGVVGATLARRHRAPWVFDVRDLWPGMAVVLGEVKEGWMLRAAQRLEARLYASADAITATTRPCAAEIERLGAAPGKVTVLPNGTDDVWLNAISENPSRGDLGMPDDRFIWTYAGNVGLSQPLEVAIEAARLLGEDFQLLILGDGGSRQRLERQAAELPSGSVSFRDSVPPVEAALRLRASDALLVSFRGDPTTSMHVPIKLYDYCAVGRPVIVAAAGEAARLAGDAGAGLCVPPDDVEALAGAVRRLRDDGALRESLAAAGRRFAEANRRDAQIDRLEQVLASLAERR